MIHIGIGTLGKAAAQWAIGLEPVCWIPPNNCRPAPATAAPEAMICWSSVTGTPISIEGHPAAVSLCVSCLIAEPRPVAEV